MRLFRTAATPFAAGCLAAALAAQDSIAPTVERAALALAHVSVLFETEDGKVVRVERSSSGFVIDPRGLLLTNEHLVDEIPVGGGAPGAEYWLQVMIGGERPCHAKLVARDERLDLALLQLELEQGELVAALELSAGATPAPGTDAVLLGRPSGGQYFALAGVVALPCGPVALRQALLEPGEALVTDAATLEDVNGGPLVDRGGVALGIVNTAQRSLHVAKNDDEARQDPLDYVLVVSAAAIRKAFPAELKAPQGSDAPAGLDSPTAAIVRAGARSVVSVWAGTGKTRPRASAPRDPHAEKPEKGLGSGVIVDPAGLVLTSSETVGEAQSVVVSLPDGQSFDGEVVKVLPASRIALVRLALPDGVRVPAVVLGSSEAALSGEEVAVIGNPYGRSPIVSAGVLAAVEKAKRLRLGAWVHAGHKGGAVLDAAGRLIGIPVADAFEEEEAERGESYLGIAQPVDLLRASLAAEFAQSGTAPSLSAPPEESAADLARRKNRVTGIVAAMRASLLNVEVYAEAPRGAAFDPFATAGQLHMLGQGSGVVIDASGLAITNWHVVRPTLAEDGTQRSDHAVEVTLPSGRRYKARVLATSRDDDLGLIQLEVPEGEKVEPVALGDSVALRRGDVLVVIGNPYGRANTVTVGILTAKDQDVNIRGRLHMYENMLQTDAAINPGNSGGAMLDLEGRLVGINSAGRAGVGLAIPVERVRDVFGQKLVAAMGPFLGLTLEDAPGAGLRVREVLEHGPAAQAGVAQGDLVRALDGRPVASTVEWGNALLARKSEAALQLDLERGGARVQAALAPLSHAAWRVFRQTGVQVALVDYAAEAERVREASIALHRAYTGLGGGEPSRLMTGALRVVQVVPQGARDLDVKPGDLLLGASVVVRTIDSTHKSLVRFENLLALRDFLEPLASREGTECECWLLRDGAVRTASVWVAKTR